MTNRQKIIASLERWPGQDDDELSRQTNVRPRQQVNQICRQLEAEGLLVRKIGPNGKIINILKR